MEAGSLVSRSGVQVTTWDLRLVSEMGAVSGLNLSPVGSDAKFQLMSAMIEL